MILAIDTATRMTTGALVNASQCVGQFAIDGGNPGDSLVSQIDRLLASSGTSRTKLDQLIVGVGPGPFTSTRVGIAVARSIGLALDVDVVGVCTLDALAAQHLDREVAAADLIVATDARRSEVYWARYQDGVRVLGPAVSHPDGLVEDYASATWIGNGLDRYPQLADRVSAIESTLPQAEWIARVGAAALAAGEDRATGLSLTDHAAPGIPDLYVGYRLFEPRPLYLRRPDAIPAVK